MAPGKSQTQTPPSSVPPALPPSVEEAYRRKCIQLKARTKEVEEANDAARLRLGRLKRQVEKMRLERAFLLEQLAKRTSTNVEDSDGSPSPPPTPKEKPLRIKRGHRKPALAPDATPNADKTGGAGATVSQNRDGAESQSQRDTQGSAQASKKDASAFDLYCEGARPALLEKSKEEGSADLNIEEELAKAWADLPAEEKEDFVARAQAMEDKDEQEKDDAADKEKLSGTPTIQAEAGGAQAEDTPQATQDEDVEMANYDTDQETQ
ncbi:hypothetical protein GQ53DRAFT_690455, partial [Thozetella sp. PMI_491]